jgi:hypothetical protein
MTAKSSGFWSKICEDTELTYPYTDTGKEINFSETIMFLRGASSDALWVDWRVPDLTKEGAEMAHVLQCLFFLLQ